jgi:hypothetical protein
MATSKSKNKPLPSPVSLDALHDRFLTIGKIVKSFKGLSQPGEFGFMRFKRIEFEYRLCCRFPDLLEYLNFGKLLAEDLTDEGVREVHQLIQYYAIDEDDPSRHDERESEENRVISLLTGRTSVFHLEVARWLSEPTSAEQKLQLTLLVLESLRRRMLTLFGSEVLALDIFAPRFERLLAKHGLTTPASEVLVCANLLATTPGFNTCLEFMAEGLEGDKPTICSRLQFFQICTGLSAEDIAQACHEDGPLRKAELLDSNLKIHENLLTYLLGIRE